MRRAPSSRMSKERVSPWNEYGLVPGFQTPPRIIWAPASFTAAALS